MDKKTVNFSMHAFVAKFQRVQKESYDPNILWRLALWGLLFGVIAVGVFAFSAYNWALGVEVPATTTKSARDAFSLAELKSVIGVYHQKEVNYEVLLKSAPQAPVYERVRVVPVQNTPSPLTETAVESVAQPKNP
jgi:hypothetical protein